MKRSPIQRRTPLSRYGSRLRAVSAKRAAKRGAYDHLRALVHAREGGNCARCGTHTPITVGECHHRLLRSRGGLDDAWNCVWLCHWCHHVAVHGSPAEATRAGWLVPSGVDPTEWPIFRVNHGEAGWWRGDGFGWDAAEPHARQAAA